MSDKTNIQFFIAIATFALAIIFLFFKKPYEYFEKRKKDKLEEKKMKIKDIMKKYECSFEYDRDELNAKYILDRYFPDQKLSKRKKEKQLDIFYDLLLSMEEEGRIFRVRSLSVRPKYDTQWTTIREEADKGPTLPFVGFISGISKQND